VTSFGEVDKGEVVGPARVDAIEGLQGGGAVAAAEVFHPVADCPHLGLARPALNFPRLDERRAGVVPADVGGHVAERIGEDACPGLRLNSH
jgi:hypothetical protein